MMQIQCDLGDRQEEQGARYLLCDSSGQIELELERGQRVRGPIQCLHNAVEEKQVILVVRFLQMSVREREALVELCATLKHNSHTRNTPVLALLHAKHRGVMEALDRAGVDFAKIIMKTT
jgi:hypothetical protein